MTLDPTSFDMYILTLLVLLWMKPVPLSGKKQKTKSLMRIPPDADSLKQHIVRANYLAYIQCHPELRNNPSPAGHGWELFNNLCKPVRYTQPALPTGLPVPSHIEGSELSDSDESGASDADESELDISLDDFE